MALASDDIDHVITEVWAPALDIRGLTHADQESGDRDVTAVLDATGSWTGHLVVRASSAFGRTVAARMFGLADDEVGEADVRDAIGEMANVLGGNLKSLLGEGHTDLGLPMVGVDVEDGEIVARSVLSGGGDVEVTVVVVEGATVRLDAPA